MEERKPWERQPKETLRAFAAFCIYRDMKPGKRSLRETARRHYEDKSKLNVTQVKRWSSRYRWVERCKAYDDYVDEQKRQVDLEAMLEMSERQARLGSKLQELGALILDDLVERAKGGNVITTKHPVLDTVRSLRTGAEIERLARGVPTQIVEEQKEEDVLIVKLEGKEAE